MPLAVLPGVGLNPGGLVASYGTVNVSSNTTLSNVGNVLVLADSTAGNLTVTLNQAIHCPGAWVFVRRSTSTSTNTVSIAAQSPDTIDGDASRVLGYNPGGRNGDQWLTIALLSTGTFYTDMFQYLTMGATQTQPGMPLLVTNSVATDPVVTVKSFPSQTADLIQVQDSTQDNLFTIDAAGRPFLGNAATPASPAGGAVVYSSGGVLKARTPDGTITQLAPGGFQFSQASASTTWSIAHNLGFYPNVAVTDSAGTEIFPAGLVYNDVNHVTLTFSPAVGGFAYLS